ncbi:hypothetical protein [Aquibacillus sediminis]|uniref:hypothetical protein n=1 Tax=Aquibacillus sediminis TaxID=2574734 RepID=UPI0011098A50|nr:hypothetical protein [Aquibacillus sediminis]
MLSIEELVNQVKEETLSCVIKKNRELVDMKYNDFESNVTFGRTFSLGQWFGYFLGLEVAKILNDHQVLIDTCLTTKKQYPTKSNPDNKRRKSYYPDILIVKKITDDTSSYEEYIKENKRTITKHNLPLDPKNINLFEAQAIIELKIDPGYIDTNDLRVSFAKLNEYLNANEEFSFKKIYSKQDEEDEFYIKNIVRFNSEKVMKSLVLATEANHPERIEEIKRVCKDEQFDFISLTSSSKHIRDYKISDLPDLENLI